MHWFSQFSILRRLERQPMSEAADLLDGRGYGVQAARLPGALLRLVSQKFEVGGHRSATVAVVTMLASIAGRVWSSGFLWFIRSLRRRHERP